MVSDAARVRVKGGPLRAGGPNRGSARTSGDERRAGAPATAESGRGRRRGGLHGDGEHGSIRFSLS